MVAKGVADGDRAVSAADADVRVQAPRVVAFGDVAELGMQAAVVVGVDDLLVHVARPRVRSRGAEREAVLGGEREELGAAGALAGAELGEALGAPGADLDLGVDQLPAHGLRELGYRLGRVAEPLEAVREIEGGGIEERELLLERAGEVDRLLEPLARQIHVEALVASRSHRALRGSGQAR